MQLIVSLVPDMYSIAARVINPEFRDVPDYRTAIFVRQLSAAGIETIYASDNIIAEHAKYPWAFFYPPNGHPSDTCQDVLASLMAERLERYHLPKNLDPAKFSFVQRPNCYGGNLAYLFPENCDIGTNRAQTGYSNICVLYNGGEVWMASDSPILILGNSFIPPWPLRRPIPPCLPRKHCFGPGITRLAGMGRWSP